MKPQPFLRGWLVTAILMLSLLAVHAPAGEAATTRVLAITTSSASPSVPFAAFDGNPPKVFDINGDGVLEIIVQNDNQYVYVFDSQTGKLLAEVKTRFPPGWTARSFNGPEVAILSGDGQVRLVLANSAATVTMYRFDAAASNSARFAFVQEWERRLTDCFTNPGMDSKPVFVDLDLDGHFEILLATEELGLYALRDDGRVFWKACIGGGNAEPSVGDINQDGAPDVVFGSDAGIVTALNGRTGATLWNYNARTAFGLGSGSMPVGPAVAQLDGVGGPDVVVGARDSHDATNWSNDHALLLALDSGGKLLWGRQDPGGNPLTYTHPIIVDAEKDGTPEVYWADWNTNGHKPPNNASEAWKVTGPGHFYRYDVAGNLVWRQTLDTWWSNKDLAIADIDGDGVQEILANGPNTGGHDGIWYLDARTGAKEAFVDVFPWQAQRGPIVADLWNTSTTQWVLPAAPDTATAGHAILVFDTGAPYDAAWPHLPYPVVGPAPPPPSGTFDATFRIKSPNQWWQEVTITSATPRTITKVEVRLSAGAWLPMSKSSWGAWTSSYQAKAGTHVEFLATDQDRAISQSAPFTWLDGNLVQGSVTPGDPPPPTFNATFEPTSSINEWWVEAVVQATEPLAGVDARVNGGSWNVLSRTSWGTWAKSFNAPRGSDVQFRATSTNGQQVVSQTFTWLEAGPVPFTATFEPRDVGNDWWVEVKVTSGKPVASVDAQVNNGTWTPLNPTTWGTWAKSFFVANGSSIRFRATSDTGDQAVSGPTIWS